MKKLLAFFAVVLVIAEMEGCKNETATDNENDSLNTDATILKKVSFDCYTTYDSIDIALKASGLPLHVEWDEDSSVYLVTECEFFTKFLLSDDCHYLYSVEHMLIDSNEWIALTFTEDITGQYWMCMWPKDECGPFYETGLFDDQAEPYTILDHTTNNGSIIVRYLDSKTYDTIPLVETGH